jgi:hypothetical protein
MSTIAIIIGAAVCLFIGTGIGILMRDWYIEQADNNVAVARKQLEEAPMVIECKLGQKMTLEQMDFDVVTPQIAKLMGHFHVAPKDWPSVKQYADEIYKWYNPDSEYTKLVIVGYLRDGRVQIAWTWKKYPKQYIINRDAISGLEKTIKDISSNPIAAYKGEGSSYDTDENPDEKKCLSY